MIAIAFLFVCVLCDCFKSRRRLETEILVLRHQLNVLQQRAPRRLHLRWADRIEVHIDEIPNELPDPIRFSEDRVHAAYDGEYAQRFWRVLLQADRVFKAFRTRFIGKCSPVHFFWGSFDLAVTRFSGRRAPRHPGGVPHLSDDVACEAYSHEVSSAGFWPGGGGIDYPAFYSYAYPMPESFRSASVRPEAAFFSQELREFVLPYDAVRTAASPDTALLDFLQSTYEAAAEAGKWDRAALECAPGLPGVPRAIS